MDLMTSGVAVPVISEGEYFALDASLFRALPFHYVETASSRQRVFTVSTTATVQSKTFSVGSRSSEDTSPTSFPVV